MIHNVKRNFHVPSQYVGVNLAKLDQSSIDNFGQLFMNSGYDTQFDFEVINNEGDSASLTIDDQGRFSASSDDVWFVMHPHDIEFHLYVRKSNGTIVHYNDEDFEIFGGDHPLYLEDRGTTYEDSFTPVDVPVYKQNFVAKANPNLTNFSDWGITKGGACSSNAYITYAPKIYNSGDSDMVGMEHYYSSVGLMKTSSEPSPAYIILERNMATRYPFYANAACYLYDVEGDNEFLGQFHRIITNGRCVMFLRENEDLAYTGDCAILAYSNDGRYNLHLIGCFKEGESFYYLYNNASAGLQSSVSFVKTGTDDYRGTWGQITTNTDYYLANTLIPASKRSSYTYAAWIGANLNQQPENADYSLAKPVFTTANNQITVANNNTRDVYFCFCPNQIVSEWKDMVWYQRIAANKSFTFTNTNIKLLTGFFVGTVPSGGEFSEIAFTVGGPQWYHKSFGSVQLKNPNNQSALAKVAYGTTTTQYTLSANSQRTISASGLYPTAQFVMTVGGSTYTSPVTETYCPANSSAIKPTVTYTNSQVTATNPFWSYGFRLQHLVNDLWQDIETSEYTEERTIASQSYRIVKDELVSDIVSTPVTKDIIGKWNGLIYPHPTKKGYGAFYAFSSLEGTIASVVFNSGLIEAPQLYYTLDPTLSTTYDSIVAVIDNSGTKYTLDHPVGILEPAFYYDASARRVHLTHPLRYRKHWDNYIRYKITYTDGTEDDWMASRNDLGEGLDVSILDSTRSIASVTCRISLNDGDVVGGLYSSTYVTYKVR